MRERHHGGRDRHTRPDEQSETRHRGHGHHDHHHHGEHHHGEHHHRGRGHRGRFFDYGELRLLLLAMIADGPRHGYELIKAIEERFGGSYTPSPGVIYPTLSWLEDMGYVAIDTAQAGRKSYAIIDEGKAFLAANKAAADELKTRASGEGRGEVPSSIIRGMENLKLALRLRMRSGGIGQEQADKISAALDQAAQVIERT